MADKGTVKMWLEICGKNHNCSSSCPYEAKGDAPACYEALMADAFDVLNEQIDDSRLVPKPVGVARNFRGFEYYYCPTCKIKNFRLQGKALFCDRCGQAMKWDD